MHTKNKQGEGAKYFLATSEIPSGTVPNEIDVIAEGDYKNFFNVITGEFQDFKVTPQCIDAAEEQFKVRRQLNPERDMVIDYEHQTVFGDQAPAAGWISNLFSIVRDGKKVLRATVREWTQTAVDYLKNKEYRYVSPVFAFDLPDKVTGKIVPMIIANVA